MIIAEQLEQPETLEEQTARVIQRVAEAAAYLLVSRLSAMPQHLQPEQLARVLQEILEADRVIITIEASERVQGLRLAIIPVQDGETLQ